MHRKGYGYRRPKTPHVSTKNGKSSIDDFPLVPEKPKFILPPPVWDRVVRPPAPAAPKEAQPPAPAHPAAVSSGPPNIDAEYPVAEIPSASPVSEAQLPAAETSSAGSKIDSESLKSLMDASKKVLESNPEAAREFKRCFANKKARGRRRRIRSSAPPIDESPLERHERLCCVCNSPYREAIEEEFLHWTSAFSIGTNYNLDRRAIYRHAHALGLFEKRDRNYRFALGHIIEKAAACTVTADAVIRAIRTAGCLRPDGTWSEPPARVIVSSGSRIAAAQSIVPPPVTLNIPAEVGTAAPLIDTTCKIETDVSD